MRNGTEKGVTGVTLVTLSYQNADNQTLPHMAVTPVTGVTANSVLSTNTQNRVLGMSAEISTHMFQPIQIWIH